MSHLKLIHQLLREEYACSRHIFWLDEKSGKWVNDISFTLDLIVRTARCLRAGNQAYWQELVTYCIERSMSALLMQAVSTYLQEYAKLEPLPTITLFELESRNWRGGIIPLIDVVDHLHLNGQTEKPEADRPLALKGEHQWSQYPMRLHAEHPQASTQTVNKSQHWLF